MFSVYEQERQNVQKGYRAFSGLTQELLESPTWKALRTVTTWLESKRWNISLLEAHWRGYVKFAFLKLHPAIPMPGQLKNEFLLRSYLHSAPKLDQAGMSDAELDALYTRVLLPEVARLPYIRRSLHIETPGA